MTTPRMTALAAMIVLFVAFVVVVVVTTPWSPLPGPVPGGRVAESISTDFSPVELQRLNSYRSQVHPPAYLAYAITVLVPLLIGLTPWGTRLVTAIARPFGGGWGWRVVGGGFVLLVLVKLLEVPFNAWSESVQRRFGISNQDWSSWTLDQLRGLGLTLAIGLPVLALAYALVHWLPRWWWAGAAGLVAALVLAISFAYPVLIEPLSNTFTPLPNGELRTSLLQLAAADHVKVSQILVADASRRTTAENAYVSGFGATKRIVLYDTLVRPGVPEAQIKLVVAHELGHAKRNDVLHGTIEGALGSAGAVCLLYLLITWPALLRRVGLPDVAQLADGRSVALAIALVTLLTFLGSPVQNLISRRIEARADVHSLDLTRDPADFVRTQILLTLSNLSGLQGNPLQYGLFASHPSTPERIGLARDWAKQHGVPVPPPQADVPR
ncbi:MAG: endopeptidase [Frankiales bacterium]|nr:endopeptidase [Frankiales bacterium]